jgi:hypothetical protein
MVLRECDKFYKGDFAQKFANHRSEKVTKERYLNQIYDISHLLKEPDQVLPFLPSETNELDEPENELVEEPVEGPEDEESSENDEIDPDFIMRIKQMKQIRE